MILWIVFHVPMFDRQAKSDRYVILHLPNSHCTFKAEILADIKKENETCMQSAKPICSCFSEQDRHSQAHRDWPKCNAVPLTVGNIKRQGHYRVA